MMKNTNIVMKDGEQYMLSKEKEISEPSFYFSQIPELQELPITVVNKVLY